MTGELVAQAIYKGDQRTAANDQNLSLVISETSFCYLISSDNFSRPVQLGEIAMSSVGTAAFDMRDRLAYLVNNNLLDQKKYDKVFISLLLPHVTLLPESFASVDERAGLLSFSTGTKNTKVISHALPGVNFTFPVTSELLQYLERTFPNAQIRHAGAINLSLMHRLHALQNADVHLLLHNGYVEISARRGNSILFYNVFEISGTEDVLYYLLFTMEQFGLDPQIARVAFSGQKNYDDPLIKAMKKYIRNFSFSVHDNSLKMTGEISSLPSHYYFTLLNQHLCEL